MLAGYSKTFFYPMVVQANGYFYFTPFFDVCKHFIFRGASAPHPEGTEPVPSAPLEEIFLNYLRRIANLAFHQARKGSR